MRFPKWEGKVEEAIDKAFSILDKARQIPCQKARTFSTTGGVLMEKGSAGLAASGYEELGGALSAIGGAAAVLGAVLIGGARDRFLLNAQLSA